MIDMCVFTVGGSRYAIPVWSVEEIFRPVDITGVPGADDRVAGIINLRGSSAAVIDLRRCLATGDSSDQVESIKHRMILLESTEGLIEDAVKMGVDAFEEPVVLLADWVHHIDRCDPERRHPPPAHLNRKFVVGVYERDYGYLAELDVPAIINDILVKGSD